MDESTFKSEVIRLAGLSQAEAVTEFKDIAKKWGVTVSDVCGAVTEMRKVLKAERIKQQKVENRNQTLFEVGSDVEIATDLVKFLKSSYTHVVYDEGNFWLYNETEWVPIPQNKMYMLVHRYDRVLCGDGSAKIKLKTNMIESIVKQISLLLEQEHFFAKAQHGINCLSGFITFADDGTPSLVPHSPEHRARHTLQANWIPGATVEIEGSLLDKFLQTMFRYVECNDQYLGLIQEAVGAVVAEYATGLKQPKCFILVGTSANNGKSTLIKFIRSLLPASALASIPPSKFAKQEYLINLAGKLLNTSDELSPSALESDVFKILIDGKSDLPARGLYKDVVQFRPKALHIYATQQPPKFFGGIDKGVRRRVVIIEFPVSIPEQEMVLDIDQQIIDTEIDLYLAWAVDGASRLIANKNYTLPDNVNEILQQWAKENDTVQDFIASRVRRGVPDHKDNQWSKFQLFQEYERWGESYDFKRLVEKYEFFRRFQEAFPDLDVYGRKNTDRHTIKGIMILQHDDDDRYTVRNPDNPVINDPKEYIADLIPRVDRIRGHTSDGK